MRPFDSIIYISANKRIISKLMLNDNQQNAECGNEKVTHLLIYLYGTKQGDVPANFHSRAGTARCFNN